MGDLLEILGGGGVGGGGGCHGGGGVGGGSHPRGLRPHHTHVKKRMRTESVQSMVQLFLPYSAEPRASFASSSAFCIARAVVCARTGTENCNRVVACADPTCNFAVFCRPRASLV